MDEELFLGTRFPGDERDLGSPQVKCLAEQLEQGFVGLAFFGDLGHRHLQRSVLDSANCVGASTRLGADRQNDPLRMLRQGNHSLTPANNALPTRTIVAPSSTAIS